MTGLSRIQRAIAGSPFVWGGLAAGVFYWLIHTDVLAGEFIKRYFASHSVEYAATTMFFVGLAALGVKVVDMLAQYPQLGNSLLGTVAPGSRAGEDARALLGLLDNLPPARRTDCLPRRLREALVHVRRHDSAESLDDELKYLADLDAVRLHSSYGLIRVIIWAIPILGFLGTVIGITLAIANLSPQALESSLPEVTAGLGVAFDTTALALGLSMILMFSQSLTSWAENALLEQVDARAAEELEGRFLQISAGPDGQIEAVRRMGEAVVNMTDKLIHRQSDIWRASMEEAAARWNSMATSAGEQLQDALAAALDESLQAHAARLVDGQQQISDANQRHWNQVQQSQVQNTQAMASLQADMSRQADILMRAVDAAGEIAGLENSLNRNLAALSGAKNFEQTVMSLAAVIHLLNARLKELPGPGGSVKLESDEPTGQAA